MKRKKPKGAKVRETFITTIVESAAQTYNRYHHQARIIAGCFCEKFKLGDLVRVTVERLEQKARKRGK